MFTKFLRGCNIPFHKFAELIYINTMYITYDYIYIALRCLAPRLKIINSRMYYACTLLYNTSYVYHIHGYYGMSHLFFLFNVMRDLNVSKNDVPFRCVL